MSTPRGSSVRIELTAIGPDGDEIVGDEPIAISVGRGDLPAAFETAVAGARAGEVVEMDFAPGEVFGDYSLEAIVVVPRSEFGPDVELEPGAEVTVTVETDDGEADDLDARVLEINDEAVILDVNHPFAGKPVTLRATVLGP